MRSVSCVFWLIFVFLNSDVNSMYLSSTEPPAAAEWACLLRPLRGREPEGIWNLLSIVREMFKRRDTNAAPLLEILTEQCLTYEQVCYDLVRKDLSDDTSSLRSCSDRIRWFVKIKKYFTMSEHSLTSSCSFLEPQSSCCCCINPKTTRILMI